MIDYPKQEGKFFYHTESKQGPVRIKILDAAIKLGKDVGGPFAMGESANQEHLVYQIMKTDRTELQWTIKVNSQIGGEMARNNVQPGDVIRITYLGDIMPTDYGNKAKYEVANENKQDKKPAKEEAVDVNEDTFKDW